MLWLYFDDISKKHVNKILEQILDAPVYDLAEETPLEIAKKTSQRLGHQVFFKREDLQPVFSFKIRGAYTKMARLSDGALKSGVITASAGNHAQGVAISAHQLGCRAVIVMPKTTPYIKVHAVEALGGEVVTIGQHFETAAAHAYELSEKEGLTFIHPYDDLEVIAGQGTIGMEILRQHRGRLDAIFVPVGGGGLIAGIASYVKRVRPSIKIIGVEPCEAASMKEALRQNHRVILPHVGRFADGVAVRQVGKLPFEICRDLVDEMIEVSTDEICAAIKDTFEDNRSILEPSGAVALAGLKTYAAKYQLPTQNWVAIASGANTDFDRLRFIADRAEMGEKREALFAVTIPEKPGSYLAFCRLLGERGISEFNYRMSAKDKAHIFVGVTIQGEDDIASLIDQFHAANLPVENLTHSELAKTHLRHMIGGRSSLASDELLYRFEFPEAPGALIHFLENLPGRWNISLFHYRNNGGVTGEVLVGLQIPMNEHQDFQVFLKKVGYPFTHEKSNPAYELFLKGGTS